MQHTNAKIDRLIDAYLDGALEESEFKRKKHSLMEEKAQIGQQIADFECQGDNRLELLKDWVIEAFSLDDIVRQGKVELPAKPAARRLMLYGWGARIRT